MEGSGNQEGRARKPRSYYVDYTKGNSRFGGHNRRGNQGGGSNNKRYKDTPEISFGHRGFLITSVDEVKSYIEMRNILEEYHDQLYNSMSKESGKSETSDTIKKVTTTEDELESELKQLRKNRPFKQVKTHCRNSIFINIIEDFKHIDPNTLVGKFFDDLAEARKIRTSNTFKVLPVLDTFRNSVACGKESVANLLINEFKDEVGPKKYFIEFQSRGNYKLSPEDKQKMIEGVAESVSEVRPEWSVNRENADYMIILIALKSIGCVSIVKDYFKRCKYNVTEFCKDFVPTVQAEDQDLKEDRKKEFNEDDAVKFVETD